MIDTQTEQLITPSEVAKLVPPARNGKRTHLSTVLRWILKGVKTPTGVVRLEAIRLGGRWLTSRAAMQRFCERLTPIPEDGPSALRSPNARKRSAEAAERRLTELGI
jgi:hypothetical protein